MADSGAIQPDLPVRVRFPVTRTLVLINFGVFALCLFAAHSTQKLAEWGPATLGGQWWRMFTTMFLHAGLGHLLGNMWWLWIVGKMTEQIFSRWTFLSLYLLTGLAGEIVGLAVHPEVLSVGASGAIFGVTGAAIGAVWMGRLPPAKLRISWRIWPLMIFTGLSLYGGATDPRIDNAAHLGGFASGVLLGIILSARFDPAQTERINRLERRVFACMGVCLVAGATSLRLYYGNILPLQTAQQALEAGKLEEAAQIAQAVIEKRPIDAEAQLFLAKIYIRKGDYTRAQTAIDRSLELDPANLAALLLWHEAKHGRDAAYGK